MRAWFSQVANLSGKLLFFTERRKTSIPPICGEKKAVENMMTHRPKVQYFFLSLS